MRRLTWYVPPARRKMALVALALLTLLFLQAQLGNTNSAASRHWPVPAGPSARVRSA